LLAAVVLGSFSSRAADSAAADSTPKRGGTLRLALPTDVTSLDPALAFDTISQPFLLLMFQGLVEYDDGTKLVPCLAQDWTVSADQRSYTFHLRTGARFSNGREVVAADFVYTLEHVLDLKTAATSEAWFEGIDGAKEFRAGKAAHVRGLKAPRDDTLIIELERPDPSFLYILTVPGGLVVPREEVERYGKSFTMHPVGSGPYVLKEWRRSAKMRFERNPLYSHPERQCLDGVEVLVGGDPTTHLMMFERGELDIADVTEHPGIPVPDFVRIQQEPRWQGLMERIPAAVIWYLSLNTEMKPFDNLKVRQAVAYAIDKQKLVQLLHGMVTPANGVLPPSVPGFNTNLTGFPHDPAKARQLLAEAGYADGFTFRLWYEAGNLLLTPPAYSIQFDLAQVGINAQLNPLAMAPLVDSQERRHTVECCLTGWSQDYPDPSDFLDGCLNGNRITEEGCQNYAFYNNPQVNQLLDEAATCQDPPRRLGLYQSAEKIVVHDAPWVPLIFPYVYALHQPWLHDVRLHPVVYFRFERMWLDPRRERK